ncbi:tRNA 4-thiouridine(8) synthase ThiI [Lentisphaera profundi]|uniref:Probable tRNA sulfurtransferase n=1 Tax=Lentisphaera profundi TaxID=1658616 RepID=A0ABY7VNE3_9BACT|nr:tRNA uracil 4-sulfurtransferase ThiI [Lentisphaera profundi]WDE95631.1 tRNA 4-thiouridine(8) synthase ThiI [Lentisphaera profundi]
MSNIPVNCFLLRYNEIGTKGKNRWQFEQKLLNNISRQLTNRNEFNYYRDQGRFALKKRDNSFFSPKEIQIATEALNRTFGLESYAPGIMTDPDSDTILELIEKHFPSAYELGKNQLLPQQDYTCRVRCRRSWKKFPYTSKEMEINIADKILPSYDDLKVNLKKAHLTIGVEIRPDIAFIHFQDYKGLGGLPVGSSDPVLCLLSGGIDSPVAAFKAMQRGSHVNSVTFESFPYTQPELIDKVAKLQNILDRYQDRPAQFYACNMAESQKMIRDKCSERFRTILYRRIMMRVSSVLAVHLKAKALLTGEAVGQVASQTLANMDTINRSTDTLVLRPLVCMDKNEVIAIAEKAGTFDVSNIQCADSCTTFAPGKPATNGNPRLLEEQETRYEASDAIIDCLKNTRLIDTHSLEETPVPELIEIYEQNFKRQWFGND